MMKKYRKLSVLLIAAMLVGLCACGSKDDGKKGDGYKKEVDTYTKEKDEASISFEIAKELGYQEKTSDTSSLTLANQENDTSIDIVLFHENSKSSTGYVRLRTTEKITVVSNISRLGITKALRYLEAGEKRIPFVSVRSD